MLETRLRTFADNTGGSSGGSTNTAGLVQSSLTISTIYPLSGGGDLSVNRTYAIDTAFLINSGRTISTIYPLSGGGDLSVNRTHAVDTAFLVNTGRTISASSGMTGGGDLSADRTFSVNTNVRDKVLGFFFAGSLATTALASSAMVYIPFNMEIRNVRLAVSHSSAGQNIMINPIMWNAALQAVAPIFLAANRPSIITNNLVGSDNGTFSFTSLYAGSWLGVNIDSAGTTTIGSNLTVTFILRSS